MIETRDGYVTVGRVGEIAPGGVKLVRLDEQDVAIFHVDGAYWAIADLCTHDGGPLAEGILEGAEIECPRHGARFDVKTGAVLSMPATSPVPAYAVRVVGSEIQLRWGDAPVAAVPVNPHTGLPYPEDLGPEDGSPAAAGPTPGAGAAFAADAPGAAASAASAAGAGAARAGESAAPSQQEMAVRSALETVMDPEINLSVIDLGLIREIQFRMDPPSTLVRMMLTTPFCPYAPQLMADVKQATMGVVDQPCEVEILPDPWSPDLMPDPGLLGFSF